MLERRKNTGNFGTGEREKDKEKKGERQKRKTTTTKHLNVPVITGLEAFS